MRVWVLNKDKWKSRYNKNPLFFIHFFVYTQLNQVRMFVCISSGESICLRDIFLNASNWPNVRQTSSVGFQVIFIQIGWAPKQPMFQTFVSIPIGHKT